MTGAAYSEDFILRVHWPYDMSGIHFHQLWGWNGIWVLYTLGRSALSVGYPGSQRKCHIKILNQHQSRKFLNRSMNMSFTTIPTTFGHINPSLEPQRNNQRLARFYGNSFRNRTVFFTTLSGKGVFTRY